MNKTEDVSFDKWKCRCSSIYKILTNGKGSEPLTDKQWVTVREIEAKIESGKATEKQKIEYTRLLQKDKDSEKAVLGDSAIGYLLESYAWETEKMFSITKEMDVEFFERGKKTEPESVKLISEVDKTEYLKNEHRFENEFLSGIPDVIKVCENFTAKAIRDIKSTKDYPTFLYKMHKGLDAGNREQLQGYGDILDCGDLGVAFTLPTMPESIRNGYKMKLAYKMDEVSTESPQFLKAWAELERSMIFNHMPAHKRTYKVPIDPFTKEEQIQVYDRVKVAREWLNNFHKQYLKLNQ